MIKQASKLILMALMALSLAACFHDDDEGGSDVHGDTPGTATPLANIDTENGRLNSPTDIDMFSVTCLTTCTIAATTTGNTDTVGEILDTDGFSLLAINDDIDLFGGNLNFAVAASGLPAGTYFIRVTGFGGDTGAYVLAVAVN